MKSLIIIAHPSSASHSQKIAKRYAKTKKNSEFIDLYDKQWQQSFLKFEDMHHIPEDSVRDRIQEKITQAEELIFIFPLWWGYVPAILKNFFDNNLTSGFAFHYNKKGKPEGLLKGKTARIFITCDAPKWMYGFLIFPFTRILKTITLGFCGIKVTSVDIFDKMHHRSSEDHEQCCQVAEQRAKE